MDCSCIYIGNYDNPEFYKETYPTARKKHICTECGRIILPGEKYTNEKVKWEGEFNTFKTCIDCLSIRGTFFCNGWLYTMLYEYLQEHINEMDGEISEDCIAELTPTAQEEVCDIIETYWKDHEI